MAAVQPARATELVFATPPGANFGGQAISAQARFDLDPVQQTITVSLLNLQMNPTDVTQLISGVAFSLDSVNSGRLVGTLDYSSGTALWINKNGVPTIGSTITPTAWNITTASANQFVGISQEGFFLCEICRSSDAVSNPDELVIGAPGPGGLYINANGSIAGNKPHNPFLLGSGGAYTPVFVIDVANGLAPLLTAQSTIRNVTLTFGTTFGANQMQADLMTPEPGPAVLTVSGVALIGVGLAFRRRRNARTTGPPRAGEA